MKIIIEKAKLIYSRLRQGQTCIYSEQELKNVKLELLYAKTWRYLRYLHARRALSMVSDWNSMVVIGAGYGLAEIALAIEFPSKTFHLTDHEGASHSFKRAKQLAKECKLDNITFGQLNILDAPEKKYDVVYSVEVLEHIKDDKKAAQGMRNISNKYIFCLVPFAEEEVNNNKKRREYVFEKFEHYVAGYDEKTLTNLFPGPIAINGCYWRDAGIPFRKELSEMDKTTIETEYERLLTNAHLDIKNCAQITDKQALGIWILSDVRE